MTVLCAAVIDSPRAWGIHGLAIARTAGAVVSDALCDQWTTHATIAGIVCMLMLLLRYGVEPSKHGVLHML